MTAAKRVAVVGTRGIPGRYGGFETLAEQLARNLSPNRMQLIVYGQRSAFPEADRKGNLHGHRRVWIPLSASGFSSLFHDALQLLHATFVERPDAILLLGVSGAWALPLCRLLRPGTRIVCNVDGLEWRRDKFGIGARRLLKWLEGVAVRHSHEVIADNAALVPLVETAHGVTPQMIAYGGDHILSNEGDTQQRKDMQGHALAIARIEPENNTAMILEAAAASGIRLVFIGNWDSQQYGQELLVRHADTPGLELLAPIYDQDRLRPYRDRAEAYVHGHSVGGTNPSLVEAIFHSTRILAFDCSFNRATLAGCGAYFSDAAQLATLLKEPDSGLISGDDLRNLRSRYMWRNIATSYYSILSEDIEMPISRRQSS